MIKILTLIIALVGIGEASYSTIAPAILSDMFTSSTRSKVLMIFYIAIPVGTGLGYMVGSQVADLFNSWQWGLRVTPILGVVCIICLIFLVREPERGHAEKAAGAKNKITQTSYMKDVGYLLKHKTYIFATLAFTAVTFVTGTLAWWAPTAVNYARQAAKDDDSAISLIESTTTISRDLISAITPLPNNTCHYADKDPSVDLIFGALTIAAGLLGVVSATLISKSWKEGKYIFRRIKTVRADAILCCLGSVLAIAPLVGGLHTIQKHPVISWVLIFLAITFLCLNWAILTDMLMYTVLPNRRSTATAIQITISHLFGDASGPYIIGLVSDEIRGDSNSAYDHFHSLLTAFYIPTCAVVISAILFLVTIYTVKKDVEYFQTTMGLIGKPKPPIATNFAILNNKELNTGYENNAFARE